MNRTTAAKARVQARRVLAYRAWSLDPSTGAIPPLSILTDPRIHERETRRRLRRDRFGAVEAVVPAAGWTVAPSAIVASSASISPSAA